MSYFSRAIDGELIAWSESKDHKPLLLRGARQIGKSTSVKNLAVHFRYFAEVNFELMPPVKAFFQGDLNVSVITEKLSAYLTVPINEGETLVFFDEIQECPEAIASLRFFRENMPNLHVVAAGSLLEFVLEEISTFGVGRIHSLYMYPMSFDEFLQAMGNEGLLKMKQNASPENPLDAAFHDRLTEQFRLFLLIGGMPEAVLKWQETGNYQEVAAVQDDIITTYEDDFAKYKKRISPELLRLTVSGVVHSIGGKMIYRRVSTEYRTAQIKEALRLLTLAGIISPVTHTSSEGVPLGSGADSSYRKYLYMDTGLYLRYLNMEFGDVSELRQEILAGEAAELVNKGALAEMAVGLEMQKYHNPNTRNELFYWVRTEKNSIAEVDYITIQNRELTPIEVKAGTRGGMKSMYMYMKKKGVKTGVRCALENFGTYQNGDLRVEVVPLYAVAEL